MKMGVFCRRSYGDPFEPVTLIEVHQAWLAQSCQLRSHGCGSSMLPLNWSSTYGLSSL
jgi:hypothetical protein